MVLTNHHCVAGCVQDLSTPQKDFIKEGFFTASREEEKQCPGMQAEILASVGDVTATINAATKGKEGQDYVRARDAAVATIERDADGNAEYARIVDRSLFGTENGLKAGRGQFQALQQAALIESKRKADGELKAKVDADPMLKAQIGDPWSEIAKAQAERVALYK